MKSMRQKMLAGELYNFLDDELNALRAEAKRLMWQHNQTFALDKRQEILRHLLGAMDETTLIEPPFYCTYGIHTHIGVGSYLNFGCTLIDNNRITIGNHVMIGPQVQIYTAAHPLNAEPRRQGWETALPVTISDDVWIGGGAIILPGVTIGARAVIGAGAVVTKDIPPDVVVVGNPARVVKRLEG